MKTKAISITLTLVIAALASSSALLTWAGEASGQTNGVSASSTLGAGPKAPPEAKDELGYDVFKGKTNKIARVYSADPASVFVIYEGGLGGRRIPRQDLPPELRSKYPYDAAKAAESQRQQAATAAKRTELATQQAASEPTAARDSAGDRLHKEELTVLDEIASTRKRAVELQVEIERLLRLPRGKGRRAAGQLQEEQQTSLDHIVQLRAQVGEIRAKSDLIPRSKQATSEDISGLQKRVDELQKEITTLAGLPKGHARGGEAIELQAEQRDLMKRIIQLKKQLSQAPAEPGRTP